MALSIYGAAAILPALAIARKSSKNIFWLCSWFYGDFMCKMHHFTQSLCHAASILILVAIAVERYLVLLHPFKSRQMMTLRRLAVSAGPECIFLFA